MKSAQSLYLSMHVLEHCCGIGAPKLFVTGVYVTLFFPILCCGLLKD